MSKQVEKIPSPSSSITYPAKSKHKAALLDLPSETEARGAPPVAHSFGNIGVHYGASPQIQPKLTVGPVNDAYEQEADRVAAQVVNQINTPTAQRQETPEEDKEKLRTKPLISSLQRQEEPDKKEEEVRTKAESASLQRQETPEEDKDKLRAKPLISSLQRQEEPEKEEEVRAKAEGTSLQRQAMPEEDEEKLRTKPRPSSLQRQEEPEEEEEVRTKPQLQRKPDGSRVVTPDLEQAITERRGSGQSLPASTREPMEQAFGADFSKVKVHTDAQADQLNRSVQARAFTTGHDIFFRQGEHAPNTQAGQELLAHELTHVVQQNPRNER